eukprot:COSAG01_NODE_23360_length_818_cov_1.036161_1_plen_209_part_00
MSRRGCSLPANAGGFGPRRASMSSLLGRTFGAASMLWIDSRFHATDTLNCHTQLTHSTDTLNVVLDRSFGAASMLLIDSSFRDCRVAVSEGLPGNGFFLFDNVTTSNVSFLVENMSAAALPHYTSWRQGPALQGDKLIPGAASVASLLAAVVTEIYLCNVCPCREILRRSGRGQARRAPTPPRGASCRPSHARPHWRAGRAPTPPRPP